MLANSKQIISNQTDIDKRLISLVDKHLNTIYKKPIQAHNQQAFEQLLTIINNNQPIALDSGCGTGYSTRRLAIAHLDKWVIGIDRSQQRLGFSDKQLLKQVSDNCLLVRANCEDLWRLLLEANIKLCNHWLFYPNPYPKPNQLSLRWHGHPILPYLLKLGGLLELRSNWLIYIKEFMAAVEYAVNKTSDMLVLKNVEPMSLFEKKYLNSGHPLYGCQVCLDKIKK